MGTDAKFVLVGDEFTGTSGGLARDRFTRALHAAASDDLGLIVPNPDAAVRISWYFNSALSSVVIVGSYARYIDPLNDEGCLARDAYRWPFVRSQMCALVEHLQGSSVRAWYCDDYAEIEDMTDVARLITQGRLVEVDEHLVEVMDDTYVMQVR
jgi:hypothetical protein